MTSISGILTTRITGRRANRYRRRGLHSFREIRENVRAHRRSLGFAPPNFLWNLVTLLDLMRLSLRERRTRDLVQCSVAGNPGRDDKGKGNGFIESGAEPRPLRFKNHLQQKVALSFVIPSVPGFPTSPLSPATTYVVLHKENHMQLTEAATLDRKSGGAEGSAVRPTFSNPSKNTRPPVRQGIKKFN